MKLKEVKINKIHGNPLQPREYFDREKIKELADSIKEVGLINPIIVREMGEGYEIVAGERRFKAGQVAKMKTLPAIIKKVDNGQLAVESLIENVHREDLNDVEKAKALKIIAEKESIIHKGKKFHPQKEGQIDISKLAKRVGLDYTTISHIFDSADMRAELGPLVASKVTHSVISETRGLEKEERKKIIERAHEEDFGGRKTRELVSVAKRSPEPVRKELVEGRIGIEEAKEGIVKHKLMEELGTTELPEPKMSVQEAETKLLSTVIETSENLNKMSRFLEILYMGDSWKKLDSEYVKKLKEHFEQFLIPAIKRDFDILKKVLDSMNIEFDV